MVERMNQTPMEVKWREQFDNVTVRVAGDFAFIWTQATTKVGDSIELEGVDLLLVHREGGRWLIAGMQSGTG